MATALPGAFPSDTARGKNATIQQAAPRIVDCGNQRPDMTLPDHIRVCPFCQKQPFGYCQNAVEIVLLSRPAGGGEEQVEQELTEPNRKELNENERVVSV